MKNTFITFMFAFFIASLAFSQNSKYPQKLENDICSNLIIGNFTCNGCAQSDRDLVDDVREDVIEALKKFKYCLVLNRDKLTDIIEEGDNENNIGMLNEEQRIKLRQIYQAERILFGKLKPQSNGSMLVTIEINNLSTTDQEGFERFVIPDDKYKNYETRQSFVEEGIVEMLLGSGAETPKRRKSQEFVEKPEYPYITGMWHSENIGLITFEQDENSVVGIADGVDTNDAWRKLLGGKYTGKVYSDGSISFQIYWGEGTYSEESMRLSTDGQILNVSWNYYSNSSKSYLKSTGQYTLKKRNLGIPYLSYQSEYPDISGIWYSIGRGMITIKQDGNKISGSVEGINNQDDWKALKGGRMKGEIKKDGTLLLRTQWGNGTVTVEESNVSTDGNVISGKWKWYESFLKIEEQGSGYYIMTKGN